MGVPALSIFEVNEIWTGVREAAGQISLVGQLFLGVLALGDVLVGAGHAIDAAGRVAQDEGPAADPAERAVPVAHPELHPRQRLAALEVGAQLTPDALQVVGVDPLGPLLAPVGELVVLVAEHGLVAGREVDKVGVQVPVPQAVLGPLHRQLEPLLAFAQLLLGQLALSDVAEYRNSPTQCPVFVPQGAGVHAQEDALRYVGIPHETFGFVYLLPSKSTHLGQILRGARRYSIGQIDADASLPLVRCSFCLGRTANSLRRRIAE